MPSGQFTYLIIFLIQSELPLPCPALPALPSLPFLGLRLFGSRDLALERRNVVMPWTFTLHCWLPSVVAIDPFNVYLRCITMHHDAPCNTSPSLSRRLSAVCFNRGNGFRPTGGSGRSWGTQQHSGSVPALVCRSLIGSLVASAIAPKILLFWK